MSSIDTPKPAVSGTTQSGDTRQEAGTLQLPQVGDGVLQPSAHLFEGVRHATRTEASTQLLVAHFLSRDQRIEQVEAELSRERQHSAELRRRLDDAKKDVQQAAEENIRLAAANKIRTLGITISTPLATASCIQLFNENWGPGIGLILGASLVFGATHWIVSMDSKK